MPSTYSPSLKLELIGNGEQAGTWGTTTNLNLGTLLEQAITGVLPITLTGDVTLTDYNGLSDQARNAVLIFNGLLGAPCNVIAPPSQKVYIVRNRSNATVTIKTTSGNGIAIANAASEVVFCDGTDFYSATAFNYINGNLTVTGNETIGGSLSVGTTITLGGSLYGNSSTDQWYVPRGNTAARTASPITGVIRYNTEANFYEGYANGSWIRFLVANQGSYTITYLVAGGGGGGQGGQGGGGGGGGGAFAESTTSAIPGTTVLSIIIGAGGAGGANGTYSAITGVANCAAGIHGSSGADASTGGAGGASGNSNSGGSGGASGTAGGGGGGGSGGIGGNGATNGGAGGTGNTSLITGSSTSYCGGGGGGGVVGGSGGSGVGGNGASPSISGTNGTIYTGGGGGGGTNVSAGQGGTGIVILKMPTVNYTGTTTGSPTITTVGSDTLLTYTSSGTYTA